MLEGDLDTYNPTLTLNEQADRLPYKTEYEFPRERLTLEKPLGEGAFGVVMKGTAIGIVLNESQTIVGVKMVKNKYDNEALYALVAELKIMMHLGQHLNVVNLLGAVTKNIGNRELMVIVEYCPFGNLLNILRNNRARFIDEFNKETITAIIMESWTSQDTTVPGSSSTESSVSICNRFISTSDLICWAFQIANGMNYLTSRKVLHGDLATRNVLLSNDNVVKISDFGLSRSLYNETKYKKKTVTPLPVRWLALESFTDALFSTHSDVWAYGILLWELFSLGNVPYPGVEINSEFYKRLRDGYRLEMPSFSNNIIYDIMLGCWRERPESRPSFRELSSQFKAMLAPETVDYYLALSEPYVTVNAEYMIPQDTE
ncbi:platelet-derived growth factor receptor alpha-like [Anopheles darlingi]|uniref:platelet-derived growth factor receptor alpha-like n=1 Tax=Anopheles darlingi TaxID=43151 RepID=UPI0021002005|nr:platelet-derived growth factor receptor alpha-like [Anopheles darlingi]